MDPATLIFSIIILIFSVVVHEVSHGYAAEMLGDPTARLQGRLTLNPLKHLDPLGSVIIPILLVITHSPFLIGWAKPVPYNPYNLRNQKWGEAIVAGAGPLVNILIAVFFGLVIRFGAIGGSLPISALTIMSTVVIVNLVLAIFNLVPIPPLDGSKILFSFLPYQMRNVRVALDRYGFVLVLAFILFFSSIISPIVLHLFNLITGISG